MTRAVLILSNAATREKAAKWCLNAPPLTAVEFRESKRSIPQNSKLWACLGDISKQLDWHGQKYSSDDWKDYMMHALKRARWMPSEEGGMVPIGMRTSELTKPEMAELLEMILAFGAQHGVVFHDQADRVDAKVALLEVG